MGLTQKDLVKACCRAIYLWELGDDEVDEADRVSDAVLMNHFATAWLRYKRSNRRIAYTPKQITDLIKNCQVRKSQISNPKNPQISATLMLPTLVSTNSQNTYYSFLDRCNKAYSTPTLLRTRWQYGREFTKELAKILNAKSTIRRGGVQRAFASRILFFALAEMHVYNYSEPLIKSLKKNFGLNGDTVDEVFEKMNDLYELHEQDLKKLPRPNFPNNVRKAIKDGEWWERRVLDLAVIQNWKCFCRD